MHCDLQATAAAAAAAAEASKPGQQQQQGGGSSSSSWNVTELWRAHAEAAHFLIAAGSSPLRPSASIQLDNAQRVIIWWPTADSKAAAGYGVGAEVIRHPVRALHIQWSPPLALPSGASSSSSNGAVAVGSSSNAAVAAAAAASSAVETAAGVSSSSAAGTGASSSSNDAATTDSEPSQGQPALMTVGVDGIIRIFVEVVMADIAPTLPPAAASSSTAAAAGKAAAGLTAAPGSPAAKPPAAAAAAAAMSQFCLTLVIEPPGLGPQVSGVRPGLLASWAKPLQPHPPGEQQSGMLWLLASFTGPDLPSQPALAAALSGTEAAAAAAAAAVGSRAASYQDQVFLWGIDGLAGVVLSGIAQNAIMSNKMSQPKVWCWGKEGTQLRWQQPNALLQQSTAAVGTTPGSLAAISAAALAGAGGAAALRHSLDVWVIESGAGPMLSAVQQFRAPHYTALQGSSSMLGSPATAAAAGFPANSSQFPASGVGLSECRCFQVTPLTGYNESGQPASAISVALKHSRVHSGQAEDWAQVRLIVRMTTDI
jgi:hypothetical protein